MTTILSIEAKNNGGQPALVCFGKGRAAVVCASSPTLGEPPTRLPILSGESRHSKDKPRLELDWANPAVRDRRGLAGMRVAWEPEWRPAGKTPDQPPDPALLRALHFFPILSNTRHRAFPMKQAQLKDRMLRRAEELARSGKYADYVLIEHVLKMEGYKKARLWLDESFIRKELNELCKQSQSVSTNPKAADSTDA